MDSVSTSKPMTEQRNDLARQLDKQRPDRILEILLEGQVAAAGSVSGGVSAIEAAAKSAAATLTTGNKLAYVGAGSSGLMAMADALELPGTFGIAKDQVKILIAGGNASLTDLAGSHEDDCEMADADVSLAGLGAGDCAMCVSASGTTPYTVRVAERLRQAGVTTIAMANNKDSRLLLEADMPILLATPPEILSGSTRMGAGTAQKIALNMFSTLMAVHLGHVHDGMMVNLTADNAKLRRRACHIVSVIASCSTDLALKHLEDADGSVKIAVLLAAGAAPAATARDILAEAGGNLRTALGAI